MGSSPRVRLRRSSILQHGAVLLSAATGPTAILAVSACSGVEATLPLDRGEPSLRFSWHCSPRKSTAFAQSGPRVGVGVALLFILGAGAGTLGLPMRRTTSVNSTTYGVASHHHNVGGLSWLGAQSQSAWTG